jgi:hypothetical protein
MAKCTKYNIMWWSFSVTCDKLRILSGYSISPTNKTDLHDITEILTKIPLNTMNLNLNLYRELQSWTLRIIWFTFVTQDFSYV